MLSYNIHIYNSPGRDFLAKKMAMKGKTMSGMYDTSVVHAKFRIARIKPERELVFSPERTLNFDPERDIDARLIGVIFREVAAVGFRNLGVSNLNEVADPEEWPDTGKAMPGETMESKRDQRWYAKWGKAKETRVKWSQTRRKLAPRASARPVPVSPLPKRVSEEGAKEKAHSFNQYAASLVQRGDYHAALMYFQKAVELDPGNTIYRENIKRCQEWLDELGGRR